MHACSATTSLGDGTLFTAVAQLPHAFSIHAHGSMLVYAHMLAGTACICIHKPCMSCRHHHAAWCTPATCIGQADLQKLALDTSNVICVKGHCYSTKVAIVAALFFALFVPPLFARALFQSYENVAKSHLITCIFPKPSLAILMYHALILIRTF